MEARLRVTSTHGLVGVVAALSLLLSGCGGGGSEATTQTTDSTVDASEDASSVAEDEQVDGTAQTSVAPVVFPQGWDIPEVTGVTVTDWAMTYGHAGEFRSGSVSADATKEQAKAWVESVGTYWGESISGSDHWGESISGNDQLERWMVRKVVSKVRSRSTDLLSATATRQKDGSVLFGYLLGGGFALKTITLPDSWDVLPLPEGIYADDASVTEHGTTPPTYELIFGDLVVVPALGTWISSLGADGWHVGADGTSASNDEFSVSYEVKTQYGNSAKIYIEPVAGTSIDLPRGGEVSEISSMSEAATTVEGAYAGAGGDVPDGASEMPRSTSVNQYYENPYQVQSPSGNLTCVISDYHDGGMTCVIRSAWAEGKQAVADIPKTGEVSFAVAGSALDWIAGEAPSLDYGHVVYQGDYVCASEEGGMTCWNTKSGHGLLMNADGFKIF